jgi:hypothetical protein
MLTKTNPRAGGAGAVDRKALERPWSTEASSKLQTRAAPFLPLRRSPHIALATKSAAARLPVAAECEQADDYHRVIVRLNAQWRVIACRDEIQWILQTKCGRTNGRPRWKSRFFCHTREGIALCAREYAGQIGGDAIVILLRLPARISGAP